MLCMHIVATPMFIVCIVGYYALGARVGCHLGCAMLIGIVVADLISGCVRPVPDLIKEMDALQSAATAHVAMHLAIGVALAVQQPGILPLRIKLLTLCAFMMLDLHGSVIRLARTADARQLVVPLLCMHVPLYGAAMVTPWVQYHWHLASTKSVEKHARACFPIVPCIQLVSATTNAAVFFYDHEYQQTHQLLAVAVLCHTVTIAATLVCLCLACSQRRRAHSIFALVTTCAFLLHVVCHRNLLSSHSYEQRMLYALWFNCSATLVAIISGFPTAHVMALLLAIPLLTHVGGFLAPLVILGPYWAGTRIESKLIDRVSRGGGVAADAAVPAHLPVGAADAEAPAPPPIPVGAADTETKQDKTSAEVAVAEAASERIAGRAAPAAIVDTSAIALLKPGQGQQSVAGDATGRGSPLRRNDECAVCLDEAKVMACYPCGHKNMCTSCGKLLMQSSKPLCPTCRAEVIATIRVWET